ncbi:hypothetical protein BH11ACT2_BH11ACT2_16220 [soil metagenome]
MTTAEKATGYRITLPAGWTRITTGEGTEKSQAAFVEAQTRTLSGADKVLGSRTLAQRVAQVVSEAEAAGALDLYSYARTIRTIPVTMNFTIGIVYLGPDVERYGDEALAALAGIDTADVSFIESPTAGRMTRSIEHVEQTVGELRGDVTRVLGPEEAGNDDAAFGHDVDTTLAEWEAAGVTRKQVRVSYLIPVPDAPGSFVLAAFDADDGALAEASVFHFDAVVSTFAWV